MHTEATELLDSLSIVELDAALADEAGGQDPPSLCSLDAIRLASAQRLGAALAAFVAYDARIVLDRTVGTPSATSTRSTGCRRSVKCRMCRICVRYREL